MSAVAVVLAVSGIVFFMGVALLALAAVLPSVTEAVERARIEREVADASWQIHQQATKAFAQMLHVARQADRSEEEQGR